MSDYVEHNQGDHEDPSPGPTWMIGFIGTVLLIIIFFGLIALFYGAQGEEAGVKVDAVEPLDLASLHTGQLALIEAPAREVVTTVGAGAAKREIDRRIVIPIDDAMNLIVQEARSAR